MAQFDDGAMLAVTMQKLQSGSIQRFKQLPRGRRQLLVEACLALMGCAAALALFPFRRAIRIGSVPIGSANGAAIEDCVWAVEAASRRLPWRLVCIHQGLAAQRMLRRHGSDARLHYGARMEGDKRDLEAHVWVTVGARVVIGKGEADHFAELASYP